VFLLTLVFRPLDAPVAPGWLRPSNHYQMRMDAYQIEKEGLMLASNVLHLLGRKFFCFIVIFALTFTRPIVMIGLY